MTEQQLSKLNLMDFLKCGVRIEECENGEFLATVGDSTGFDVNVRGALAKAILYSLIENETLPNILINNQKVSLRDLYYDEENCQLGDSLANSMALRIIKGEEFFDLKSRLIQVSEFQANAIREALKIDVLFEQKGNNFYIGDQQSIKTLGTYFDGYEILKAADDHPVYEYELDPGNIYHGDDDNPYYCLTNGTRFVFLHESDDGEKYRNAGYYYPQA